MGSGASTSALSNNIRSEDYYPVDESLSALHHPTLGGRVLKNKAMQTQIQEYNLTLSNSSDFENYLDIYHWRQTQENIVRTLHLFQEASRGLCSVNYFMKVYIERVPIRIKEISDIPYPDNLYVLLSALNGFSRIVEQFGYFDVDQNLIGINRQGEVKVWVHDNLSLTVPEHGFKERHKGTMVQKIIDIVDQNTDHRSEPESLKQFIAKNARSASFSEAIVLVKEFARLYRTQIPSTFGSILELLGNPGCLQDDDFNLSESNVASSIYFKKPQKQIKGSQMSLFSKLEKSIASSTKNPGSKNGYVSNQSNVVYGNRGTWGNPSNPQMLPPSIVTQSIPVTRASQYNQTNLYPVTQTPKQSYAQSIANNSMVQQVTFCGRLNVPNVTEFKETFNPHQSHYAASHHSSVYPKESVGMKELSQLVGNSDSFNPLVVNDSTHVLDQLKHRVRFANSPRESSLGYSGVQQSEMQSAYFEKERVAVESPRSKILKMRRDQENIMPQPSGKAGYSGKVTLG